MLTFIELSQVVLFFFALLLFIKPLGHYMYCVYAGKSCGLDLIFGTFEWFIYRTCHISPEQEMTWKEYLKAIFLFNFIGLIAVYLLQRLQGIFILNPQNFSAVPPDLAFNTAASFTTNTNWQAYAGESTLSYLTQMLGLTVQNFLSAATGLSAMIAFIRGLVRHDGKYLGNFWVDTVRSILYILLPLSSILAIILISQGTLQNFKAYQEISLLNPFSYQAEKGDEKPKEVTKQLIPMGPAATQVAIKQIGTNGGGYFNTNSTHPFENPTPLTNFLQMLAILLIPAALCYTFGLMVGDTRQGRTILVVMLLMLIPMTSITIFAEYLGNPALPDLANMEGKETRFGIANSALWSSATTATSNGSVNSMLDSYTPLGLLGPLWLMQLGEVIFGGIGTGLLGMLVLIIVTVFIAGLMVGRTPEYLGKKIEPYEMKMASVAILIMPLVVLLATGFAVVTGMGSNAVGNPGPRGLSEILYAFTSMTNNNGSSLSGLNTNTPFYNILGGIVMLIGRYWIMIPTLAIAGSLVQKKLIPQSVATLPTYSPLFIFFLISVVLIVGALTFLPALFLGPIVEHLLLWTQPNG